MTSISYRNLANKYVSDLIPYQPGKPIEEVERELGVRSAIKLASNENPLGASAMAIAAATEALQKAYLYPDGGCFELKNALANFLQVEAPQLTIGNGSENVLELIIKAYLNPQASAIISEYAFLTIPILIKSYGAKIIRVPARRFNHDIRGMIARLTDDTRIIFVVNPNNPTGTYTTAEELHFLLTSVPPDVLVVVDEAYYEYIQQEDFPDTLALLPQFPNLIITRTFSKAYGLAALRLGYAISSLEIADILNRARLPFNVNTIAAKAACAALQDQTHIQKTRELNERGKQQLMEGLQRLDLSFIPSIGNFLTIALPMEAMLIYQQLLLQGVIVRPLSAYHMPQHIRVTIGTQEENKTFLTALGKLI